MTEEIPNELDEEAFKAGALNFGASLLEVIAEAQSTGVLMTSGDITKAVQNLMNNLSDQKPSITLIN